METVQKYNYLSANCDASECFPYIRYYLLGYKFIINHSMLVNPILLVCFYLSIHHFISPPDFYFSLLLRKIPVFPDSPQKNRHTERFTCKTLAASRHKKCST